MAQNRLLRNTGHDEEVGLIFLTFLHKSGMAQYYKYSSAAQ